MLPFGYAQAHDLKEAVAHLAQTPQAMPLAGGTDMLQLLQESVLTPVELIDLSALPLAGIAEENGGLRIGALTRLADVADHRTVRESFSVLARALSETASPQVRHMATVGGNLLQRTRCLYFRDVAVPCNKREPDSGCPAQDGQNRMNAIFGGNRHCIAAYPGDMANALVVLDAALEIAGPNGSRTLKVESLHREPGDHPEIETVLEPGEIITAITIPQSAQAKNSHYVKVRDRASFEWAIVSAAAAVAVENDQVRVARISAGGVGTKPWRLPEVERMLVGRRLDEAAALTAGEAAANGADPRPGNAFKMKLLQRAVSRVLMMAGGLA